MKSRITIELDFDNGNSPFIQVLQRDSDDVRDSLIKNFFEQLSYGSTWGIISCEGYTEDAKRWRIFPIPIPSLKEQAEVMLEQHRISQPQFAG